MSNHIIPGMNAAKSQGKGTGYHSKFHQEMGNNEPLTEMQKQHNKKRKKNQ